MTKRILVSAQSSKVNMVINTIKRLIPIVFIVGTAYTVSAAKPQENNNTEIRWKIPQKNLPLPSCASTEVQKVLSQIKQPNLEARKKFSIPSKAEWKAWEEYSRLNASEGVKRWADKYHVEIRNKTIDGVNVYYLLPSGLHKKQFKHLFVYLHGGAYIFGGGVSGLSEGILIAARTQIPVIAIDYRMPPDYPFPAAVKDVVRVYQALLKTHNATSIAMGGSSSGGGLTLATIHQLKSLHITLPGALFIGTPWADLSKCGDSLYTNEGIDRKIVTYDGFIAAAAKLYANGQNLKNPYISPVYGDFTGFPPTMLITGTRDLFLSLTVRVHRKMKAAGVIADLNVYEGLSHVEYFVIPNSPESKEVYKELQIFLKQYLQ